MRVLLDTSFLLPTLGIDTGGEASKGLKKLAEAEAQISYSTFSILESLWTLARTIQKGTFDLETFRLGLRSIMESGRYDRVAEDSEVFSEALKIYRLGHRDMIDNILYASSLRLDLRLLTLDGSLKEFIETHGLTNTLVFPDQLESL